MGREVPDSSGCLQLCHSECSPFDDLYLRSIPFPGERHRAAPNVNGTSKFYMQMTLYKINHLNGFTGVCCILFSWRGSLAAKGYRQIPVAFGCIGWRLAHFICSHICLGSCARSTYFSMD